jgi:macrolide-specific efflux system membrane fusion protein
MSKNQKLKRKTFFAALAAFALLLSMLAMGGCSLFPEEEEPISPPLIETGKPDYVTVNPTHGVLEDAVEGIGQVVPNQMLNAAFNAQGILETMNFEVFDRVEKGDILCTLDNGNLEDEMQIYEWTYEIAKIQWIQAQIQFQRATMEYENRKAQFEATVLRAPMSGIIIYKNNLAPGSEIYPGTVMYTIADTSKIYIEYNGLGHNRIPLFAECQLTLQDKSYTGIVVMTPELNQDNPSPGFPSYKTYSILIEPEEAFPDDVQINTSVSIYYLIERNENALLIPRGCLRYDDSARPYVYVLQDGYRQRRDIETGLTDGYYIEVVRGLSEDDLVIK